MCFLTVEVDGSDVAEQQTSLHGVHAAADPRAAGTQILVHAVQSVGHSVNCIDHKLDLPLLLVGRVAADPLLACRDTRHMRACLLMDKVSWSLPCPQVRAYLCISSCQGPV